MNIIFTYLRAEISNAWPSEPKNITKKLDMMIMKSGRKKEAGC